MYRNLRKNFEEEAKQMKKPIKITDKQLTPFHTKNKQINIQFEEEKISSFFHLFKVT